MPSEMPSESSADDRMLVGECECGAVRYQVADAFLYAANCHCSRCRAATGSAFKSFDGIEREKLEITQGMNTLLVFGEDDLNHTRCGVCGSFSSPWCGTVTMCTSRWARWWMPPAFDQPSTSSSAPRHPGSTSPTTCLNPRSTSSRQERNGARGCSASRPETQMRRFPDGYRVEPIEQRGA
jgi:hypothetical protein